MGDWLFLSKLAAGLGWVRVDRGWVSLDGLAGLGIW